MKSFHEFFAGIGLVREGLERSGWRCTYANDIDPKKREMYEARFGASREFHLGDVWDAASVLERLSEPAMLATASFPCVDLSLAGAGKGFGGERSSTFFGFVKVLEELGERRPAFVLLENVAGFLTSRGGADFESAVRALAELGYWIDAFTLDARWFVPQSRPRVFVLGIAEGMESPLLVRRETSAWFDDPWLKAIEASGELRSARLKRLMNDIELATGWVTLALAQPEESRASLEAMIDTDDDQAWWDEAEVRKHYLMMSPGHRAEIDRLRENERASVGTIYRRIRQGEYRAETRFDGLAGCLRTPRGGSGRQIVAVAGGGSLKMRWMSPREYARLQGAAGFPLPENERQALMGFGDAVCASAIQWIDERVLTPLVESANQGLDQASAGVSGLSGRRRLRT